MTRRRGVPVLLLLSAVVAAATFVQAWIAYGETRGHLDRLVRQLGGAIAEAAAADLRSSRAVLDELERELEDSLRWKAEILNRPTTERPRDDARVLERFARAAGLTHLFVFDEDGALTMAARDVPQRSAGGALAPARLRLALENAVRSLASRARDGVVVRELELPAAGLKSSLAAAMPLRQGGTAVLIQDAAAFARVREAAGVAATLQRLEEEMRIAYVRFGTPAPAVDPERVLALEREVDLGGGRTGVLRVGIDRTPALQVLAIERRSAFVSGTLLVAVVTAAAWGLLRLARARDALRERVRRDERLSALGRLAASIAHEVRNPLNAIGIAAQRIRLDEHEPGERGRLAGVIEGEVERLNRTVEDILGFASRRDPRVERIDGAQLLATVEHLARPEARARGVELVVKIPEDVVFHGDADLLQSAAWNLVRNALRASPSSATVTITLVRRGDRILLDVMDQGPGVPEESRALVFEPFHSGGAEGSGLGLPIALGAAQAHGGTIEILDAPGGGAIFRMTLPDRPGGA
jgi:signal transduction histidine kinase